jgi:hypothetical protein
VPLGSVVVVPASFEASFYAKPCSLRVFADDRPDARLAQPRVSTRKHTLSDLIGATTITRERRSRVRGDGAPPSWMPHHNSSGSRTFGAQVKPAGTRQRPLCAAEGAALAGDVFAHIGAHLLRAAQGALRSPLNADVRCAPDNFVNESQQLRPDDITTTLPTYATAIEEALSTNRPAVQMRTRACAQRVIGIVGAQKLAGQVRDVVTHSDGNT